MPISSSTKEPIRPEDPFTDEEWDEILDLHHERVPIDGIYEYFKEKRNRIPYRKVTTFRTNLYKRYDARQGWRVQTIMQRLGIKIIHRRIDIE